jgi:hypothetical protein
MITNKCAMHRLEENIFKICIRKKYDAYSIKPIIAW